MDSCGSWSMTERATVRPPNPESKMPMGASLNAGSGPRSSPASVPAFVIARTAGKARSSRPLPHGHATEVTRDRRHSGYRAAMSRTRPLATTALALALLAPLAGCADDDRGAVPVRLAGAVARADDR